MDNSTPRRPPYCIESFDFFRVRKTRDAKKHARKSSLLAFLSRVHLEHVFHIYPVKCGSDIYLERELTSRPSHVRDGQCYTQNKHTRRALPELTFLLMFSQGRRNWGRGAAPPLALYQEGQGGRRWPFELKENICY